MSDNRIKLKTVMAAYDFTIKDVSLILNCSIDTIRKWTSKKVARKIPDDILDKLISFIKNKAGNLHVNQMLEDLKANQ